jgi:hypothetical protein
LVAGPASDWIGIQSWFFMAGVAMAICGLLGLILPATKNIEQQKQPLEMPIRAFSKTAQDS